LGSTANTGRNLPRDLTLAVTIYGGAFPACGKY
jgi:hypothetical protein